MIDWMLNRSRISGGTSRSVAAPGPSSTRRRISAACVFMGNSSPSAIRAENGQRLLEHAAHHAFHVVRALHRAVDPVHALEEPQVLPALLLGALALGDVADDAEKENAAVLDPRPVRAVAHPAQRA